MVAVVRVAAPYYPPRDHLWRFELGERVRAKGGAIGVVVARGYHVQVTSEDGRTVAREWPEVLVEHMDPSGAICWEWVGELDAEPARWHTERIAERYAAILAGVELVGL